MLKGRADAPGSEYIGPDQSGPNRTGLSDAPAIPPLDDLDYRVRGLLQTDSKMSEILVATDPKAQTVIFKIACVQQRARAETNRRAIHNSVAWLEQIRGHTGVAQMQPIRRKDQRGFSAWFAPPTFVATLPTWPGNPEFHIMEYLAGGTLSKFVGKRPLPIDIALVMAYELAQTLAYLHAHHCVHRDLKPENILFRVPPTSTTKAGEIQPVLIDFGVAARIGEAKLISGSRLWMAPEIQDAYEKSLQPVDPTWDVYALGLICCYMLSGIRPRRRQYDAQDTIDYRNQVFAIMQQGAANTDATWQQAVADLQPILAQTIQVDPRQRPTATEFAEALSALLTNVGIPLPKRDTWIAQGDYPMLARLAQMWEQTPRHWRWRALIGFMLIMLLAVTPFLGDTPTAGPMADGGDAIERSTTLELAVIGSQPASKEPLITKIDAQESVSLPPPTIPPPTLALLATEPTPTISTTPLALIRLLAPPASATSAQEWVEFAWESLDSRLSAAHCYELVFWDPTKTQDKRSPLGASHTPKAVLSLDRVRASPDPLLRTLVHSSQGFDWGVRIVTCATPQTILQDVNEIRHYTVQSP